MHVLMLGWEFPPFIAGGLGTACHGLTKALDRRDIDVTFVLPQVIERTHASHVNLLSPASATSSTPMLLSASSGQMETLPSAPQEVVGSASEPAAAVTDAPPTTASAARGFAHVRFIGVPAEFHSPYQQRAGEGPVGDIGNVPSDPAFGLPPGRWVTRRGVPTFVPQSEPLQPGDLPTAPPAHHHQDHSSPAPMGEGYEGDLIGQVHRFEQFCLAATRNLKFDVIHAHDWMTYPAGLAIARLTGKPLVVHVHSTEFDRSGIHVNQRVYDIERRGMHGAMRVIAVSQLTKNVIQRRYSVPGSKVEVVYNGVDIEPTQENYTFGIHTKDKIVLYFGRITYQKGPEYFIAAAKRVLEVMPDVKFVVAGSGDQARGMIEMAANLGIGHKVLFTGFLRGRDIKRIFSMADLYVMPSVSEPFGIAPLEAMGNDVPVLISKSSGVSELLVHALKVDFWDIDDMADKIIAVLRHPPLSQTLREHGAFEVRKITWDGAASRCDQIYRAVIGEMSRHSVVAK